MSTNVATNYLNSKGRRIFKSAKGAFYSVGADGKKVYKPKASFRKSGGEGAKVKITAKRNSTKLIPSAIRPAVAKKRADAGKVRGPRVPSYKKSLVGRKKRTNAGVKRGVRPNTLARREAAASARRRALVARRRIVGNGKVTTRKVRTNKGVKRGVRAGPAKPRKNVGVARGPRQGVVQRRMNAGKSVTTGRVGAARASIKKLTQLKTPTEAELYQMIFGTPPKRKVRANKGVKRAPRKVKSKSPLRMMLRSGRAKK